MSKSIKYFQNTLVVHVENNAHAYVDWGRSSNRNKIKPNFSIFSRNVLVPLQQKGNNYALHLKTILSTPSTSTMSMI